MFGWLCFSSLSLMACIKSPHFHSQEYRQSVYLLTAIKFWYRLKPLFYIVIIIIYVSLKDYNYDFAITPIILRFWMTAQSQPQQNKIQFEIGLKIAFFLKVRIFQAVSCSLKTRYDILILLDTDIYNNLLYNSTYGKGKKRK